MSAISDNVWLWHSDVVGEGGCYNYRRASSDQPRVPKHIWEYIPRIWTWLALFHALLWHGISWFYPYLSGLLFWHCGISHGKTWIWVKSRNCGCLVTWFCYQLIAKPGNKTAAVLWPDPYVSLAATLLETSQKSMILHVSTRIWGYIPN